MFPRTRCLTEESDESVRAPKSQIVHHDGEPCPGGALGNIPSLEYLVVVDGLLCGEGGEKE